MRLLKAFSSLYSGFFAGKPRDLQPRDILDRLIRSMEDRKMGGFDRKYLVPNRYTLYLNPFDYEDISPFLSHAGEQLKNKVLDRIRKKGYNILSPSLYIDIRKDESLLRNQLVIKSSFLEGKESPAPPVKTRDLGAAMFAHRRPVAIRDKEQVVAPIQNEKKTKVIEEGETKVKQEPVTKCLEKPFVNLEIVEGADKGMKLSLKEGEYVFGRSKDADILLKDPEEFISRKHFMLVVAKDLAKIRDLGGLNRTYLNDIEIAEASLASGDQIRVGKTLLKVA